MCERLQILKKEKIAELPVFAMISFAARCVRRVKPLFGTSWSKMPGEYIQIIENSIALVEKTAESGQKPAPKSIDTTIDYDSIAGEAKNANDYVSAYIAYAVKHLQTTLYFPPIADNYIAEQATNAVNASLEAAKNYLSTDEYNVFLKVVWRDFDELKAKAEKGEPIPHNLLGELWPEGKPPGWPTLENE
jgi:hypothetical protein